ncbi:Ig-like domain repeat protein [Geothrix sp. 21YS21S-2]|uniref:Ig-like domain repeat protein n=1 Tax=Geothrix sp. 21YS21S-2 TaxID=3068893 RepID=UPI0027BAE618|nr:Ig-like domain repeat protein [Geothrix sp. 21YS21S-2]
MPNLARIASASPGRPPFRWLLLLCLTLAGASPVLAGPAPTLKFKGMAQATPTGSLTLNGPAGLAVAPNGTTFIADTANGRIIKVDPTGAASVLGVSGLGTALAGPTALALDVPGNLYIADTGNARVVKVATNGTATVVGTGSVTLASPQGVAVDASGNLFIADAGANAIVEVTTGGSAAGLAINVSPGAPNLASPKGLAFDAAGKLHIADAGNNRIVAVAAGSTTGGVVAPTWAGSPASFSGPSAVAFDRVGNLFVADTGNNRIVVMDTALNAQNLNTGNWGLPSAAPAGVAVDIFGTVHIADTGNSQVVEATLPLTANSADSTYSSSFNRTAVNFGHATLGAAAPVTLTLPVQTMASPAYGSLKVLTAGVQNLDFTLGAGTTIAAGVPGSAVIEVKFLPTASGQRTGAVVLYDDATPANIIMTIPLVGFADAPVAAVSPNVGTVVATGGLPMANPYQVALDGAGNLYCGVYSSSVVRIPAGGGSAAAVPLGTPGGLANLNITGVALDGAGNLFVGDHQRSRILVVTPDGVVSVLAISGLPTALGFPTALAFDGAGNLLIADFTNGRILRVSSLKVTGSTASGLGAVLGTGAFTFAGSTVTGMTVDPFGSCYIAARTQNSSSIVKVTAAGAASALALPGITISNPQGVSSDAFGNIYVVDTGNSRIVKVTTAGLASAVALSGLPAPATLGSLLFGVTADPAGNLYIPDWTNGRIVYANVSGGALSFAATKQGFTSTDSPKTATVANLGNQDLAFSADPTFTGDFSGNPAGTNPVTSATVLAPGTSANVSVMFTPQSVGSLSAAITLTDNSLNVAGTTQAFAATGTGTNPGDTTSTTVTLAPSSLTNGQAVTLTATLADTTAGHTATLPTGTVTFTDTVGGTTTSLNNGASVTVSAGKAVLSGVVLTGIGSHTITASYAGVTGAFLASSGTSTVALAKAPVALLGPATTPTATLFDTAALTATATGPYTTIARPTGTLAWSILNASSTSVASGTAALTAGSTSSSAAWSVSAATLGVGTYTVSFTYGGDANYLPVATAATYPLVIAKAAPAVALASSATPSLGLAPVTFTATATGTGGTPTGSVGFYDGATLLGTATLASGTASYTTSALAPGTHAVTAVYAGDGNFAAITSAALSQVVQQLASTVTLTRSSTTGSDPFGVSVTFTAAVANAGGITPTGTVTFLDGTTALATVALSGGTASYATSALALGTHSITASYAGDGANTAGVSSAVTETTTTPSVVIPTPPAPVTVADGGTATTQLTLASMGALGAPVTLAVTGLPAGAACTFDHPSFAVTGTPVVVTATFTTTPRLQIIGSVRDHLPLGGVGAGALLLGGLFAVPSRRRKRAGLVLSTLALLLVGGLTACGGGTSSAKGITTGTSGTPAGSYAVTITASSQGAVQATSTFTLTVN